MPNYFSDNQDIMFHFNKRIDFEAIFAKMSQAEKDAISATTSNEMKNTWFEVLDTVGALCGDKLEKNAKAVEEGGIGFENSKTIYSPTLESNLQAIGELQMSSMGSNPKYGGMGAPFCIEMIGAEMLNRACPSTMLNVSWYSSIARIIEEFGTQAMKEEYLPRIAAGEISGNMALTEPDAGSDLAAIRAYATKQQDDSWLLYGTKRFITNGTSELSLVLAKSGKGLEGLENLSLFLCPRTYEGKENIKILKLEHKIGLHASATCELAFDGAKAYLLGKVGEGFRYMLKLMNDSRIGVGFQGIGLMEATWQLARNYANERKTWGKPIAHHELIAEKLLDLEVELKATRSLGYQASYCFSQYAAAEKLLKQKNLSEETRKELEKESGKYYEKMRTWTPLLKYWVGEKSIEHARICVQIHGGYGFTTEYRAEWWVRESLIYALYEGTSQIQALMCLKDTLKGVVRRPRQFIESALGIKVKGFRESNPLKRKLYKMKQLTHGALLSVLFKLIKTNAQASISAHSNTDLMKMIKGISKDLIAFENLSPALLHAERLCEMLCYEHFSSALIEDALIDDSRKWVAERFIHKALPKMVYLKSSIESEDPVLNNILKSYADLYQSKLQPKQQAAQRKTGTHDTI